MKIRRKAFDRLVHRCRNGEWGPEIEKKAHDVFFDKGDMVGMLWRICILEDVLSIRPEKPISAFYKVYEALGDEFTDEP